MLTKEELQGQWDQLRGQIREKWGQLTDNDLQQFKGNGEQLVGMINQKTGAAKKEIEAFLDEASRNGENMVRQAAQKTSEYAQSAAEGVHRFAERASNQIQDQYSAARRTAQEDYEYAQDVVKTRPMQSLGFALGVGLVAGTIFGLMMRSTRS